MARQTATVDADQLELGAELAQVSASRDPLGVGRGGAQLTLGGSEVEHWSIVEDLERRRLNTIRAQADQPRPQPRCDDQLELG